MQGDLINLRLSVKVCACKTQNYNDVTNFHVFLAVMRVGEGEGENKAVRVRM